MKGYGYKVSIRMLRYRVCDLHMRLVKQGEYYAARLVLKCLRDGRVTLRLDDDSWLAQEELEKAGCRIWYSSNGNKAEAYLVA